MLLTGVVYADVRDNEDWMLQGGETLRVTSKLLSKKMYIFFKGGVIYVFEEKRMG
jgi:hypothetical protein